MQAIKTKYVSPSNTKGARISVVCEAKRIILSWDHALNSEENHRQAALELIARLGWSSFAGWDARTMLVSGSLAGEHFHILTR